MRPPLKPLAVAGMIGPSLFVALVIAQGVLQPDYSHIAMPISALAAWPVGWLQNLNFFISAVLLGAFAIGVDAAIRRTRVGLVGIVLLLASSVGLLMAGLFPWINVNGVPTETPRHIVAAVITLWCARRDGRPLRRMTAEPRWRDLSAYVLFSGIAVLLLFIVVGGFAIDEGTPLHRWAGLLQRVMVAVWFACLLVIARRVLRLAREDSLPSARARG